MVGGGTKLGTAFVKVAEKHGLLHAASAGPWAAHGHACKQRTQPILALCCVASAKWSGLAHTQVGDRRDALKSHRARGPTPKGVRRAHLIPAHTTPTHFNDYFARPSDTRFTQGRSKAPPTETLATGHSLQADMQTQPCRLARRGAAQIAMQMNHLHRLPGVQNSFNNTAMKMNRNVRAELNVYANAKRGPPCMLILQQRCKSLQMLWHVTLA